MYLRLSAVLVFYWGAVIIETAFVYCSPVQTSSHLIFGCLGPRLDYTRHFLSFPFPFHLLFFFSSFLVLNLSPSLSHSLCVCLYIIRSLCIALHRSLYHIGSAFFCPSLFVIALFCIWLRLDICIDCPRYLILFFFSERSPPCDDIYYTHDFLTVSSHQENLHATLTD